MRRDSTSGFTLIEVLVALAIAVLLLVPLLRSFSVGVASATRTDTFTAAILIAESTLETVGRSAVLVDGGGLDQQTGLYHVSASVHRYLGDGSVPQSMPVAVPYEVMVTVSWQEAAQTQSVALRTLRLALPPAPEQRP